MPRSYKPVSGITRPRKYAAAFVTTALQAMKMGCSQRKAASVFNIPRATLSNIINGLHMRTEGGQTVLSNEE